MIFINRFLILEIRLEIRLIDPLDYLDYCDVFHSKENITETNSKICICLLRFLLRILKRIDLSPDSATIKSFT